MIIEMVGYLGSFLVLVSFLMTSVFKLRVINTIGSVIFTIYALIIHSYPTAVMNACLVLINLRFLWKMRGSGHHYELVEVSGDDKYLKYLLSRQSEDIEKYFPGISITKDVSLKDVNRAYIITSQGNPVGITIGREKDEVIYLVLDYSFPEYRDLSVGEFLVKKLKEDGIDRLVYDGPTEHHMEYLEKLGYTKVRGHYEKVL